MAEITREAVVDYLNRLPAAELAEIIRKLEEKWSLGEAARASIVPPRRVGLVRPPPAQAEGAALVPRPRTSWRAAAMVLGGILFFACCGVAVRALFAARPEERFAAQASASVAAPVPSAAPSATAEPRPAPLPPASALLSSASAMMSAAPPAASVSSEPAEGPAQSAADVAACVASLFPADSLDSSSDLSFVCTEPNPIKGGSAMRSQLVRGGHSSPATKNWGLLGWYEMAAFAVIQAQCCPSAAPPKFPEVPRDCGPLSIVVSKIVEAAHATPEAVKQDVKDAVDTYTRDVYCIVRSGAHGFPRHDNPEGGEDSAFLRFMRRVVKQSQKAAPDPHPPAP